MKTLVVVEDGIPFSIKSGSHGGVIEQKGTVEIRSQAVEIYLKDYGGGGDDIAIRLSVEEDGTQRVTLFDGDDDEGTVFTLKPAK